MNDLEVVLESPTRLTYNPNLHNFTAFNVNECEGCSLHVNPHQIHVNIDRKVNPDKRPAQVDYAVLSSTPDPSPTIRNYFTSAQINPLYIGAVQCPELITPHRYVPATSAQLSRCRDYAISLLSAAAPRWIFLVGQDAVNIWLGQVGDGTGRLHGETDVLEVRNKSKTKRKVSKIEVEAKRSRREDVLISDVMMRVGIWPELGAWVYCISEKPTKGYVYPITIAESYRNPHTLIRLTQLSTTCTKCPSHTTNYTPNGLSWCREHYAIYG
jgi:hypothetical protein